MTTFLSTPNGEEPISYLWRPSLRDPDDEMVLEAAMNGGADRLLTFNERDFVGANRWPRLRARH
jgi:predicted nucleic acid-binding protein